MRTTLDVDEDVLIAAKTLAKERGISVGRALSDLARRGVTTPLESAVRNGVTLFPRTPGRRIVTLDLVNDLRDEAP